jgi:beta-1,4-mannosyl-glycoprotein beta-1,4-N-acetylglucosaminyltransferase
MKIIDCFIFYNEEDLLNYRLNILNDYVDYFILVESTMTFVGKKKELYYNKNKAFYEKFNDKIIHIVVDLPYDETIININNSDQWKNEFFQRNSIKNGIDKLNLDNEDIIIVSDLDEIPDYEILKKIINNQLTLTNQIMSLEQDFYYYNLNSKLELKWNLPKILTYYKYNELNLTINDIRLFNCDIVKNAGWHLSYFGDTNFIKNKLENFSHQELNKEEFIDTSKINKRINDFIDIVDRNYVKINKISIIDNKNLPHEYNTYLNKFIIF